MLHLYSYPQSSQYLIDSLNLAPHPEGGHFAVTFLPKESIPSPYTTGKQERLVQTTIYYLLSIGHDASANGKEGSERIENHSSAIGVMHKNRSTTMHLHHTGRVIYTLISTTKPVEIKQVTLGEDSERGEVRQLVVDGNWWKVSEIPQKDREKVEKGEIDSEYVGGLISEVVTPGFDWSDHEYMTESILKELLDNDEDAFQLYKRYCKRTS